MAQKRVRMSFGGLATTLDATKCPPGRAFSGANFQVETAILQSGPVQAEATNQNGTLGRPFPVSDGGLGAYDPVRDVFEGAGYGKATTNVTYTIEVTTGIPTSGQAVFKSPYSAETFAVQFNDSAANVAATLLGLSDFANGEATVTGGPFPYLPMQISFAGQYAGLNPGSPMTYVSTTFNNSAVGAVVSTLVGGTFENYLVVIHNVSIGAPGGGVLYAIADLSGGAWTQVQWTMIANNLAPGQWKFAQYGNRVYGANGVAGIGWYQLGGASWSQPAGISGVTLGPAGPSATPGNTYLPAGFDGTGSSEAYTGWTGGNPTASWGHSTYINSLTLTATATLLNSTVNVTITLPSNVDFSEQFYWETHITTQGSDSIVPSSIVTQLINATPTTITADVSDGGNVITAQDVWRGYYFGQDTQALRTTVKKISLTFQINQLTNGQLLGIFLYPCDSWMNDTSNSLSILSGPTKKAISYAYNYLQVSTQQQTKLSAVTTTAPVPTGTYGTKVGNNVLLTAPTSGALTGADLVQFWRKDITQIWRLIAAVPNTGGFVSFTDANMADQVQLEPPFGQIVLPGGFTPTQIAYWKDSLVVSAGGLVFMSYTGLPQFFAPSPDDFAALAFFDTTDPLDPRTLYMAPNRADTVVGMVGQDGMYLAGAKGNYAMVNGSYPNQLTAPLPIKNARGAVTGYQSVAALSGGMMVATTAGLYYYSVGDYYTGSSQTSAPIETEITEEIEQSWLALLAASPGNMAVCENLEELWAVAGTSYLHRSRHGHWESGTLAFGAVCLIPVEGNPLVAFSNRGVFTTIGAGVSPWNWQTGILDGERENLHHFEVWYTGTPSLKIEYWDSQNAGRTPTSTQSFSLVDGKVYVSPLAPAQLNQGWRYRLTFASGTGADTVTDLFMVMTELPVAKGN